MTRPLGTNADAQTLAQAQTPRWLLQIDTDTPQLLADGGDSSGSTIMFAGKSWTKTSFKVAGLKYLPTGRAASFSITIPTDDRTLLAILNTATSDTNIKLYKTFALSSYAGANDVKKVFDGSMSGGWSLQKGQFTISVINRQEFYPNNVVNAGNGFTQISAPGEVVLPDGTLTIRRYGT